MPDTQLLHLQTLIQAWSTWTVSSNPQWCFPTNKLTVVKRRKWISTNESWRSTCKATKWCKKSSTSLEMQTRLCKSRTREWFRLNKWMKNATKLNLRMLRKGFMTFSKKFNKIEVWNLSKSKDSKSKTGSSSTNFKKETRNTQISNRDNNL